MKESFRYFTTPIYYANGKPHAGHVYATILGRILKLHYLSRNAKVKFLTGLDEHGEAVEEEAKKQNVSPKQLVDSLAEEWRKKFDSLGINYDIFMRTTSEQHIKNVQSILSYCYEKGDIYFGEHEGHYCVKCESFLNLTERDEHDHCLIHKRPTEIRKESNYFFKTSKYKAKIKKHIENGDIVIQEKYKNELLGLLENLSGDLSISRPKSRLTWGIELPFDTQHVTYVWFDALPNYVTGVGGIEQARDSAYWKNAYHILGKDILKFHGVFWPAMCLSLDLPLPKLIVTGWILKNAHKMSKSIGNIISVEHIMQYGTDAFVNYVYRISTLGEDIDFSWQSYFERFNADLANGLGNLTSRTLTLCSKYFNSKIPVLHKNSLTEDQIQIFHKLQSSHQIIKNSFDEFRIEEALKELNFILSLIDKHITKEKPWELNISEHAEKIENILATAIAALRFIGFSFYAFFPEKMQELLRTLGEDSENIHQFFALSEKVYNIKSGHTFTDVPKLFARLDVQVELKKLEEDFSSQNQNKSQENKSSTKKNQDQKSEATAQKELNQLSTQDSVISEVSHVSIDDFSKIDLRVATVTSAEFVEGSDKLLKLVVSLGVLGSKVVFSGIKKMIRPEEITNKKVIIVNNLAPRKMKFGTSEGMLLVAQLVDGKEQPIFVSENHIEGAKLL